MPKSHGSRGFTLRDPRSGDLGVALPQAEVAVLQRGEAGPLPIEKLNGLRELPPLDAAQRGRRTSSAARGSPPRCARATRSRSPIFRLDADTMANVPGQGDGHLYQYLTATAPGDAYLSPCHGPGPTSGGTIAIEVLLNLRQSPTGSAVSVAVRDPVLGGGLGYLSSGSLEKAAVVFTDVESMLYSKVSNPLGAAAGGYVLIGTETSGEPQRWDEWLGNLRRGFRT